MAARSAGEDVKRWRWVVTGILLPAMAVYAVGMVMAFVHYAQPMTARTGWGGGDVWMHWDLPAYRWIGAFLAPVVITLGLLVVWWRAKLRAMAVVSLVLMVLVVIQWTDHHSERTDYGVERESAESGGWADQGAYVSVSNGVAGFRYYICHYGGGGALKPFSLVFIHEADNVPPYQTVDNRIGGGNIVWQAPAWWRGWGFDFGRTTGGGVWSPGFSFDFEVPCWLLLMLCMPLPLAWVWLLLRRRRAARAGLCQRCGYDLRASAERCPECGTPITLAVPSAPEGRRNWH